MKAKIYKGDCLEIMKLIPDNSIDLVLTDPPYGTTKCPWDSIIDLDLMWEQLKRVTKINGAIILFGQNPFTASLIMSNPKMYRYDWIWEKKRANLFQHANKMPMRNHEIASVFYKKLPLYNPQFSKGEPYICNSTKRSGYDIGLVGGDINTKKTKINNKGKRYPTSIVKNKCGNLSDGNVHPTQKPVPLLKYLINTYTKHGETVLDFTMGSASTGEACRLTYRDFIGIEQDNKYFDISKQRLKACGFHDLEIIE